MRGGNPVGGAEGGGGGGLASDSMPQAVREHADGDATSGQHLPCLGSAKSAACRPARPADSFPPG